MSSDIIVKINDSLGTKCGGAVINTPQAYQALSLPTEACTPPSETQEELTTRLIKAGATTMVQSGNINSVIPVHIVSDISTGNVVVVNDTENPVVISGGVTVSASQAEGLKVDNREMVGLLERTLVELIKQNIHLESMTDERILDIDPDIQGVI